MRYLKTFSSPIGAVTVVSNGDAITEVRLEDLNGKDSSPLLNKAENQLLEYLCGLRRDFDLPIELDGTDFQLRVWQILRKIPYGDTISYKTLAKMVGSEKAYRAVGMANHRNKIPIIIPCHRVINADGTVGGYAGGAEIKGILLDIERGNKNDK